jgi:hypothetical protein
MRAWTTRWALGTAVLASGVAARADDPTPGAPAGGADTETVHHFLDLEKVHVPSRAQALGNDPERLLAFVRDEVAFVPYPGVLLGAEGTLVNRRGNSLDRSLLLAEMLRAAGREVRFARARIGAEDARARVDAAVARGRTAKDPLEVLGVRRPAPFRSPDDPWRRHTSVEADRLASLLGERAHSVGARVDERAAAIEETRDHWWVQVRTPGAAGPEEWRDLDPSGTPRAPVEVVDAIPEALHQRALFRVVLETKKGGAVSEATLVEVEAPIEVLRREGALLLHGIRPKGTGPLGLDAVAGSEVIPLLVVGEDVFEGSGFTFRRGRTPGAAPRRGGLGGLGDMLGGGDATLSERLEIVLSAPGAPDETVRRFLFDRVGADARAKGADLASAALRDVETPDGFPEGLRSVRHVSFSAGLQDVEDYLEYARAAVDLEGRLETGGPATLAGAEWTSRLLGGSFALLSQIHLLALAAGADALLYEARPRVLVTTLAARPAGDRMDLEVTVDLALDRIRAVGREGADPKALRAAKLRFGVGQGFLEDHMTSLVFASFDASDGPGVRESLPALLERTAALSIPWRVVERGDGLAVEPEKPVDLGAGPVLHGWEVDAATGDVSAASDEGLGKSRKRQRGQYREDYKRHYNHFKRHGGREQARNAIPGGATEHGAHRGRGFEKHWHTRGHSGARGNVHSSFGKPRAAQPTGYRQKQGFRNPKGGGGGGGGGRSGAGRVGGAGNVEGILVLNFIALQAAGAVMDVYPVELEEGVSDLAADLSLQLVGA